MKRRYYKVPDPAPLDIPGAKDVRFRVVIGQEDGAPNFTMLLLEIAPGGNGPDHNHPWEELIFIKSGRGVVKSGNERKPIEPGITIFFAPGEPHQFINNGREPLEFLCIMPHKVS